MRLFILTMILGMASLSVHAADLKVALSLCPQDGRNTIEAFHTTNIAVNDKSVSIVSGGTEPNFSSEIQWLSNGDVVLLRKNKTTILLGNGERPDLRAACGIFTFERNVDVDMSIQIKKGLPYPRCGDSGCVIVHPETDTVTIKNQDEVIVYVGNKG